MVAVVLTKNWDKAPVVLDTANIASAEEIPGEDFGADKIIKTGSLDARNKFIPTNP